MVWTLCICLEKKEKFYQKNQNNLKYFFNRKKKLTKLISLKTNQKLKEHKCTESLLQKWAGPARI